MIPIIGVSPILVLGTVIIIAVAPAGKAGAASSLSETGNQLGIALGMALPGSIGTWAYRTSFIKHHPAQMKNKKNLPENNK
jgi:DHA2 family multidrug resistance protein-like MFS transporter